jgi:hypothetical protein
MKWASDRVRDGLVHHAAILEARLCGLDVRHTGQHSVESESTDQKFHGSRLKGCKSYQVRTGSAKTIISLTNGRVIQNPVKTLNRMIKLLNKSKLLSIVNLDFYFSGLTRSAP